MVVWLACGDGNISLLGTGLGAAGELGLHLCVFVSSDRRHLVACLDSGAEKLTWSQTFMILKTNI